MEAGFFIGGLLALSTIVLLAMRFLHSIDVELSESLDESSRVGTLTEEAMRKYPSLSQLSALQQYANDLEQRVTRLRDNAMNTDVVYAIRSDLRDRTLLLQEVARLININVDDVSEFDVRTAAQV
jgi:hypothetical protein